ncbi:MAG: helix-turn-helix domain-containing protein [Blastocatellia bacterium]
MMKLSYKERSELEAILKSRASGEIHQRAQALLLLDEEESATDVAELLRVSRQTVYNWVARFEQRATWHLIERLADAPRSGRPVTAKGVIEPLIDSVIDSDPRDYGYNSTVWTADLLRRYLNDSHQEGVGLRSVGYALERLAIRWKHPRHTLLLRAPFWRQAKGG